MSRPTSLSLARFLRPAGLAAALGTLAGLTSGCIEDSDCGVCDPDNLNLQMIRGRNYLGETIALLSPTCSGDNCPEELTEAELFTDTISRCEETDDAKESPRGSEVNEDGGEFCQISPNSQASGIEFIFNNLLDPTSIELVRKRIDNPQLFQVYDWKDKILGIRGPITRFNGDLKPGTGEEPDLMSRSVNLTCIDNLAASGVTVDHTVLEAGACEALAANGLPLKLEADGVVKSYSGQTAAHFGGDCDTPDNGPDTCCNACDYELSVNVAKYGLKDGVDPASVTVDRAGGDHRTDWAAPGDGAITCDADGDVYAQCAGFNGWVTRADEQRSYTYAFCDEDDAGCSPETYPIPYYDQLRETHPDERPASLQRRAVPCQNDSDCDGENNADLPGAACIGRTAAGAACDPAANADDCWDPVDTTMSTHGGRCEAEWFVTCRAEEDNLGTQAFCVDKRFSERGAAACYQNRAENRLATLDADANGVLSAEEACPDGSACDPLFANMDDFTPVPRYDRNGNLPDESRGCFCEDNPPEDCTELVDRLCRDEDGDIRPERAGHYARKFVTKVGGVVYDPAVKGFEWRPAHLGNMSRARVETCSEARSGGIGPRNREDGWLRNDGAALPHHFEDFDRSMCSGSEYTVTFAVPEDGDDVQYVQDKVGNTLSGKAEYTFRTAQFHIEPESGHPADNLRIGACNDFRIGFSNKYDMSAANLAKLQLQRVVNPDDPNSELVPVAGGLNCGEDAEAVEGGALPCLEIDVRGQAIGEVTVQIDPKEFGAVLEQGETYRFTVPSLSRAAANAWRNDPAAFSRNAEFVAEYEAAFWDVCGMPLITDDEGYDSNGRKLTDSQGRELEEWIYQFTVDAPKCKEDKEFDRIQLSCDNAPDHFNPGQEDADLDGFGDVIDLCATVASTNNTADSDNDGVGNDCDTCRQAVKQYNDAADDLGVPDYLRVRNIPFQDDTDQDGIGDACDNCVQVPNCEDYGPSEPWSLTDPIAFDNDNICQTDANADMIGDACEGETLADAAGPVGFGDDDDFDQDGLANLVDKCPRQPVTRQTCSADADCGDGVVCTNGLCNHLDTDVDGVGNECDTCPFAPNPMQKLEGGMQTDDPDGDFVGNACETDPACETRKDARRMGFYEHSAGGFCCTTQLAELEALVASGARDPIYYPECLDLQVPITIDCAENTEVDPEDPCHLPDGTVRECFGIPNSVGDVVGMLSLPPGCDEVLQNAGIDPSDPAAVIQGNPALTAASEPDLWSKSCFLPSWDQDFDGVGDICDLCPLDWDPDNRPYIDSNNKLWPKAGRVCNGEFSVENKCGDDEGMGTTGGEDEGMGTTGG